MSSDIVVVIPQLSCIWQEEMRHVCCASIGPGFPLWDEGPAVAVEGSVNINSERNEIGPVVDVTDAIAVAGHIVPYIPRQLRLFNKMRHLNAE